MLLVGCRSEAAADLYPARFLLQNWWERRQFIEVNEMYLISRAATAFVVKTPQQDFPAKLKPLLNLHCFAQTAIDQPEWTFY